MWKRILFYVSFAALGIAAAALSFFIGVRGTVREYEASADTPMSEVPAVSVEIGETPPAVTASPKVPEAAPAPPVPPENGFLVLVDRDHPMDEEPPVVNISELLTAGNAICDSRRHANGTAILALDEMFLAAAEEDGELTFVIASAFRSLDEQRALWGRKLSDDPYYGQNGEPLKLMPPRCSEHITGLAFDILSPSYPHSDDGFANSREGVWLRENAWRFGFVLRYPADKQELTGVAFEPWHFRYVGKEAAEYMHTYGLCLEEYLALADPNG